MKVTATRLPEVLLIELRSFSDDRGFFTETWRCDRYQNHGIDGPFVQDNMSKSCAQVIRGLHLQVDPNPQGKLVSALRGSIWDVAVDVRVGSPTFGQWVAAELSDQNLHQLWIPPGFAHGFAALEENTVVHYKCTAPYDPNSERSIRFDDPDIALDWPVNHPIISQKDAEAPLLRDALDGLPRWMGA